ncbi:MAG: hypothetical protein JXQ90_07310 [Cyclobacteriaceae bacterium]
MPNHIHLLVFVQESCNGLNGVMANAKRFMAYEVVKRLEKQRRFDLLSRMVSGVQANEKLKGKKHQVFRLSFDASEIRSVKAIHRVLDYIHYNPVKGKWSLADGPISYPYSSARFYDTGRDGEIKCVDFRSYS